VREMGELPPWGRVAQTKGQRLPETADDRLSAIKNDKTRYPRWTPAMADAIPKLEAEGRKWFQLYDKVADIKTLEAAWKRIDKRTTGSARERGAGPDGVTVKAFAEDSEAELNRLCKELKSGKYEPAPVRRHYIPKLGKSGMRPLGLPTIADKVAQEALRGIIEPVWESRFSNMSHGFRPGRSTDSACLMMEEAILNGKVWIVDADIKGCFDNIPHEVIIDLIAKRISDGKILGLIRDMLKAGVMEEMKVSHSDAGTPQGGIISPLLCNIVLNEFDIAMQEAKIETVRYADDYVLLCNSRQEAEEALAKSREALAKLGLMINEEKTRIIHIDEGFDFLGWRYKGRQRWPRDSSVKSFKAGIRMATRRTRPGSITTIAQELEPRQRGWFNYFRNGNSAFIFGKLDGWLRRRLRTICNVRVRGKSGISSLLDNMRMPIQFFNDHGLFNFTQHLCAFRYKETAALP